MLKDIKATAKHSIIYALGNMSSKVVGLVLIPLYTNPELLSTSEFGAFAVLEATIQLLVGILAFAMPNSLSRWYWDKRFEKEQKSIFFTSFLFLSLALLISISILFYFSNELSGFVFKTIDYGNLVKLTILTAGFQVLNNLTFMLLRLQTKSVYSVSIQSAKFIGLLVLVFWGLKIEQGGLLSIVKAYFYMECIILIIFLPTIIRNFSFRINIHALKGMFSYGFPLMLASVSGVLLMVTDRYMLNSMEGLEKTAIYSVGARIARTLKIVVTSSLTLGLLPLKMKKIGQKGSERFFSKTMKYSSFLFSIALLFISLFSLEILKLITGADVYLQAHGIVAIISFALLFEHLKNDALMGITIKKKTKISGSLIVITSLLNIGLNLILIPILDIYGAAFATLISQVFFFITIYIASQREHYIPYELKRVTFMILVLIVFVILGLLISDVFIIYRISFKILLFLSFPFSLLVFGYYEKIEKERLVQLFKAWRNPQKFKENLKRFISN